MMDMHGAVKASPKAGSEQVQNPVSLLAGVQPRIETRFPAARNARDKKARAERRSQRVDGANVTSVLNPAVPAGQSLIVQRPDRQHSALVVFPEPRVYLVQQGSGVPAIIVGECDNLTR